MPYVATANNSVNILHVVRDVAGDVVTSSVTGFAVTVLDPSQNDDSSVATWTEPVTTGYLSIAITPDEVGNWLIKVVNPTGTDEGTYYYNVQAVANAAGLTPSGTYLSTLSNLKERLGSDPGEDAFLTNLLARATTSIETWLGRGVIQATYTEYPDGNGTEWLSLRQGPLISVTSVATADWSSHTVNTTSSLTDGTWLGYGDEDDWKLPAKIRSNGGAFTTGRKNYQVVYAAGWAAVPYDIEQACLDVCVWMFNMRRSVAESSKDVGAGAQAFRQHNEMMEMLEQLLGHYKDFRC